MHKFQDNERVFSQKIGMTIADLAQALEAEIAAGEKNSVRLVKAFAASDLLSDVLTFEKEDYALLTSLTNAQIIRTADITNACCVVILRGKQPQQQALALAENTGIPILLSHLSMFEACVRLSNWTREANDTVSGSSNPAGARADVSDQGQRGDDL